MNCEPLKPLASNSPQPLRPHSAMLACPLAPLFAPLFALALASAATAQDELPYQELADTFRAEHGLAQHDRTTTEIGDLLTDQFLSARVGLFEVHIPRAQLANKETASDFRDVCAALGEAQTHWLDWIAGPQTDVDSLKDDLDAQLKWIEKWKLSKMAPATDSSGSNALDLFEANEELRALVQRSARAFQNGTILGASLEVAAPVRLVLMPERKEFVEFLAFCGWLRDDLSPNFWVSGMENWTEFRIDDLQVIALQHPAVAAAPGSYDGFTSMKDRSESGLEQQVVQLGMNKFLAYMHGSALPTPVLRGFSVNMLIEMYGVCETRNDGDMRGRITQARSMFVSGGQSEGGQMGQNVAKSRWRLDSGKHHYSKALKQAQKSGATEDRRNKNRLNTFLLNGDKDSDHYPVHAPFFGPEAGADEVPDNARGDYSEFLRAYNVAFSYWLQSTAGGPKKKSEKAFARLLSTINAGHTDAEFGATLVEIYGRPLTDPDLSQDCLEGQFLKWLSRS